MSEVSLYSVESGREDLGVNLRTTTSLKGEAVPSRARVYGLLTVVSLNPRLASNKEEEGGTLRRVRARERDKKARLRQQVTRQRKRQQVTRPRKRQQVTRPRKRQQVTRKGGP
jgi:hypothetical protein